MLSILGMLCQFWGFGCIRVDFFFKAHHYLDEKMQFGLPTYGYVRRTTYTMSWPSISHVFRAIICVFFKIIKFQLSFIQLNTLNL